MLIAIIFNAPQPPTALERQEHLAAEQGVEVIDAVESSLIQLGHATKKLPVTDDISSLLKRLSAVGPDLVFNLCESFRGESLPQLNIPALLEVLGIRYTGSGPAALGLSTDKAMAKALLSAGGVPVPECQIVYEPGEQLKEKLSFPVIVKPLYEDGSYGIRSDSVVDSSASLSARVLYIRNRYRQPVIIEEFINGREINAAILGYGEPVVLPLSEIKFHNFPDSLPKICTFEAKWMPESFECRNTVPVCPASLPDDVETQIRDIAAKSHVLLGCKGYSRVDFRLDSNCRPYVIEVNANPDITPGAGYIRSLLASGRSYADFAACLVEGAFKVNLRR